MQRDLLHKKSRSAMRKFGKNFFMGMLEKDKRMWYNER